MGTLTALVPGECGPFSYVWDTASGDVGPTVDVVVAEPTTFTVVVMDENECVGSQSITIFP